MYINFKKASRSISVVAAIICIGGFASFIKSDSSTNKALALNIIISSGAIAVGNQLLAKHYQSVGNDQITPIIQQKDKQISDADKQFNALKDKYSKQTSALNEVREITSKQSSEIEAKNNAINILNSQIKLLHSELVSQSAEIERKLQEDDTRFTQVLTEFKQALATDLSERIYQVYNGLQKSIDAKLASSDYEAVHPQLENFSEKLEASYSAHCEMLASIPQLEGDWQSIVKQAIEIYSRISDQITTLKVRYRNLLNTDERLSLEIACQRLEASVPKDKAREILNQFSQGSKSDLEELLVKIDDNQNSLEEMRGQVSDLLNHIDSKNLEIAKLNQQIAELKRPQYWSYAVRPDLGMANGIIQYFEKLGIVLDRAGSNYQGWYADLSFHAHRNGDRVTLSALNTHWERLAPQLHCLNQPEFKYDAESDLFTCTVWLTRKPVKSIEQKVSDFKPTLAKADELINFVSTAYHIGLWGETGTGKSTAISNIIGGLIASLGGSPKLKLTIPKLDNDTQKIFPSVDYLGIPESIFGLLEAALEIQFRISLSEQAFRNGETIPEYEPIVFFIDEINAIFTRWGKINDADLENVLGRFTLSLSGERLNYFNQFMREELENYKNEFAKTLLKFIWQTGRSLNVKSLIAGQNLQPGAFRVMVNDIANCAYIALGDAIKPCIGYKVKEVHQDSITSQYNTLQDCLIHDSSLRFAALYCPSVGKAYLGELPPPNYYQWDANLLLSVNSNLSSVENAIINNKILVQQGLDEISNNKTTLDGSLDGFLDNVQSRLKQETMHQESFRRFVQESKLPKKFQNLGYEALLQLWTKLPKKADGSVMKTKAYSDVFEVKRSEDRKIVSEFINYLEAEFK
ncbi:chromosome partition protein Smc (plasmid) [Calothrix brevissima NIES-22]|nr:chromosome partition protein Smc [Calothrix brevissima NIES-22]